MFEPENILIGQTVGLIFTYGIISKGNRQCAAELHDSQLVFLTRVPFLNCLGSHIKCYGDLQRNEKIVLVFD